MSEEYNGHANYATWLVSLWANNDETQYKLWRGIVENQAKTGSTKEDATNLLRASFEMYFTKETAYAMKVLEDARVAPALCDYMKSIITEIDFYEIAEEFTEDFDDLLKN